MKVVSMWSGGKDSCYACYKAIQSGHEVKALINFIEQDHSISHGLPADIIASQAKLTGIQCLQYNMEKKSYRADFIKIIEDLKGTKNIEGIVFGDIYLQEHKDWINKICVELKVKAILPLWGMDTEKILDSFIKEGFEAFVVSAKEECGGESLLGEKLDTNFKNILMEGIDLCGERGEFHTFVSAGPMFIKKMELKWGDIVLEKGFCYLSGYELLV